MKKILSLAVLCIGLSGCMTNSLWDGTNNNNRIEDYGVDQVQGFGVVQQGKAPIEAGQLVMQGEKFWYVVNNRDSQYMYKVLSVKRTKPYTILSEYKTPVVGFPVQLYSDTIKENTPDFISSFCLSYQPENEAQRRQLSDLYFEQNSDSTELMMCRHIRGTLVKPSATPAQNKLSMPLPVKLTVFVSDNKKVQKVLLSPFALVADIVITPFAAVGTGIALGACAADDECRISIP